MIEIYTDGSCLTNPGNGGWTAIINDDGKIKKISGNEKDTTNNRMELLAPINALRELNDNSEITIYTDSRYVKLGITEWINKWLNNNWQTSKKEDVKNKDLWGAMPGICCMHALLQISCWISVGRVWYDGPAVKGITFGTVCASEFGIIRNLSLVHVERRYAYHLRRGCVRVRNIFIMVTHSE